MDLNNIKRANIDDINVVIFHADCNDGYGGLYAVYYHHKNKFNLEPSQLIENIKMIPCQYDIKDAEFEKLLDDVKDKHVLVCDFSFKQDKLNRLVLLTSSFILIDHHKTAQQELENLPSHLKIFDMNKSGAYLVWEWANGSNYENVPQLIKYIQDRDIWQHKLPLTKEFNCGLFNESTPTIPDVLKLFDQLVNDNLETSEIVSLDDLIKMNKANEFNKPNNKIFNLIQKGKTILEVEKKLINTLSSWSTYVIHRIENELVIVAYSNTSLFQSDLGNQMLYKHPFADFSAIYYFDNWKYQTKYSFRSLNDRMDVGNLSKILSEKIEGSKGGGHRNASGWIASGPFFELPFEVVDRSGDLVTFMNKTIQKKPDPDVQVQIESQDLSEKKIAKIILPNDEKGLNVYKQVQQVEYQNLLKRKFSTYDEISIEFKKENVENVENVPIIISNNFLL